MVGGGVAGVVTLRLFCAQKEEAFVAPFMLGEVDLWVVVGEELGEFEVEIERNLSFAATLETAWYSLEEIFAPWSEIK